ncbi:MotA/TolQ/ExbB proton channel family protein [Planomicrobium chinense]|uniref:MotA/TolQ/ExbB proton channel family protein n=1 Tax=Planococcus chinensis TaxID=272917 RepID=UPI001CC6FC22|nr:MotA/TolQ/ExbB proton channel family protein [Planococcus chinensis]MBZ5201570.1 MotA/TolQ/ExbB proton channel family protein [Planococcus chinensis]
MIIFGWFDDLFKYISERGLDPFTNGFMAFQLIVFGGLIIAHLLMNRHNYSSMIKVKKGLRELDSQTNIEALNFEINKVFNEASDKSLYKQQWDKYYKRIKKGQAVDEKIRVEPFFGYDAMHDTLGRRHILDYGGGLHVSLGVLGTFIGLAIGLSGLNVIDPEVLREGVAGLIGGMKTAFYTSVLGVVLSLIWIFVDRAISAKTNKEIDWHIDRLHYFLNADDEEIFLNRLEKITQQQSEQMKTLLTDALEKAMNPFIQTIETGNREITNHLIAQSETSKEHLDVIKTQGDELTSKIAEQITPFVETIEAGNKEITSHLIAQSETSKEHLNIIKTQGDELSSKLIEQITSATSETIEDFNKLLKNSQTTQQEMFSSIDGVVGQIKDASTTNVEMLTRTNEMVSSFSTLTDQMDSTQKNYAESQEQIANLAADIGLMQGMMIQHVELQGDLNQQNREFMLKSDELVNQFVDFGNKMSEVQQTMIEDLVQKTDIVSRRFESLSNELVKSTELQLSVSKESADFMERAKTAIAELIPLSSSLTETVTGLGGLAQSFMEMKEAQSELIPQLEGWNQNLAGRMTDFMSLTETNLKETTSQIKYSKEQWDSTAKNFAAVKNELSNSLGEFKSNIESGVQTTFQQFDQELKEAVQHFKIISDNYGDSIEILTDYVEQLRNKVELEV